MAIPENIKNLANKVRTAIYGKDVRESIAKSMEETGNIADEAKNTSSDAYEITQNLLDESFDTSKINQNFEQRLDNEIANLQPEWTGFKDGVTAQLAQSENEINQLSATKANKSYVDSELDNKADKVFTESQLELKRDKATKIKNTDLDTATDANKIKLINLSDEVQQALTGNAPALSVIPDGGVTTTKYANNSVTNAKINLVYKRGSVILGNIYVNTATKKVSWDNLVVAFEEHYGQPIAGERTYTSTLSSIFYNTETNTIEVYTQGNFSGLTTSLTKLVLIGTIYGDKVYNVTSPDFWIVNGTSLKPPSPSVASSFWTGAKANFIGDSITDYSTYPEKVKEILGLSVARNYGVGGGSLCYRNSIYPEPIYGDNKDQMIDDAYPPVLSRWQDMDDDADIIFVLIGTNDYSAQVPLGSVSVYSDTEFNGGLNKLLDGLRAKYPTKLIVVSTLLRRLNDTLEIPLTAYNEAIIDRCESRGIIWFDAYNGTGLDFKKDQATKHTTKDGLHPNDVGDDILAHRIATFINSK